MSGEMVTVKIILDGEEVELKPTLMALKQINSMGGVNSALRSLDAYDFDTYVTVVMAGLNGKRRPEYEERVFRTGMPELNFLLARFCVIVANGGRDPMAERGEPSGEG